MVAQARLGPGAARRRPRALAVCAALLLAIVAAWALGFGWFVYTVSTAERSPPPRADGIVALTGGADRVEAALRLLTAERGRVLLISGVGAGAALTELERTAGVPPATIPPALAARITLGRAATSTRGNAAETATWAAANDIHSLIVVTAAYHMPRALAELSRTLPSATLYPAPVQPPALRGAADLGVLRLLASEYSKWLIARAGLSGLVMPPSAGQATAGRPPDGGRG